MTIQSSCAVHLARFATAALLALGLFACGTTPMSMQSQFEAGQLRPLQRVLIVANGELFPDSTRQSFFLPSAEGIRQLLVDNGVNAWSIEMKQKTLNPIDQIAAYAKTLEASHVLLYNAAKVSSLGPRNSATEYKQQQRLISDYELSFTLLDMTTRRAVWKGEMRSGSDYSGTDAEIRQIRERLQEHLARARLMKPAATGGAAERVPDSKRS